MTSPETTTVTLAEIEQAAHAHHRSTQHLASVADGYRAEAETLRRKYRGRLKAGAARVGETLIALRNLIQEAPHLFSRPRTIALAGFKVGLQKGKGKVAFGDSDRVVAAIRKHLADEADSLIVTKETPDKTALAKLDARTLAKLGCTLTGTADEVVVKRLDTQADRLIDAIVKDALAGEE